MSDILLEVSDLCKRFGALQVTDHVSLSVRRGEVHALIGPNGAGKTTLMGQLTGELTADSGSICFLGRDMSGMSSAQRARLGLARSFQITSIFDSFTAAGNVALAVQATEQHSFKFWRPADRIEKLQRPADDLLRDVGLVDRRGALAAGMSHGEHRQLELAMALATRPTLLLLDEPMAGLGTEESEAMAALLQRLKRSHTILLVEHDMDIVFALADRISVLVYGRIIASGTPDEIRNDPEVRAAYLGDDEADFAENGDA
jgi:branched-chain amino acid transport system ATP-binding protein